MWGSQALRPLLWSIRCAHNTMRMLRRVLTGRHRCLFRKKMIEKIAYDHVSKLMTNSINKETVNRGQQASMSSSSWTSILIVLSWGQCHIASVLTIVEITCNANSCRVSIFLQINQPLWYWNSSRSRRPTCSAGRGARLLASTAAFCRG